MKKIFLIVTSIVVIAIIAISLTGCTFQVTTSENSVTASVDEATTETVNNVFDWILERIERVFNNGSSNQNTSNKQNSDQSITHGESEAL